MDPNLIILFLFAGVGFAFVFLNLVVLSPILRPGRMKGPVKGTAYECGMLPVGDAWIRFNPRFFLIAIVFVLFDVELAFLFPWAAAYRAALAPGSGIGLVALLDLAIFLAILLAGYAWVWKRGDLKWILPGR